MLKILNSLTGDKEEFIPINKNEVLMYVCGITPYSDSHVGHGMSYVIFDVMKRTYTKKHTKLENEFMRYVLDYKVSFIPQNRKN